LSHLGRFLNVCFIDWKSDYFHRLLEVGRQRSIDFDVLVLFVWAFESEACSVQM
jgi:hypothetical protein